MARSLNATNTMEHTRQMLWQVPTFAATRHLEAHSGAILAEAQQLTVADYDDWPQTSGYTGGWKVFGVFCRNPDWHLAASCLRNGHRCPDTARVVRGIPGVAMAGFSMFLPGTHVAPHTDGKNGKDDLLRCHLGLICNDKAGMRVNGTTVQWRPGQCLVFDGAAVHEAANFGAIPRVILMVDIDRTALLGENQAEAEG